MRRLLAVVLSVALVPLVAASAAAAPGGGFSDVPSTAYFASPVEWLEAQDITTGTGPGRFSPDDVVTRAQMATFLHRYSQEPAPTAASPFGDVAVGSWYSEAVAWLAASGVTTGTSPTTFSPDDEVTRAQMATFLWRFRGSPAAAPGPFSDVPAGQYYTEAVGWLAESGITTGTSPTTFSPDDVVSRAQMATFLWRLAGSPAPAEPGTNRVGDDVTVAAENDFVALSVDPAGTSTLRWNGDQVPPVGQIVAIGITDQTPHGLLGRVVAVAGRTVTTEPVPLSEAVPEVDISIDLDDVVGPGSEGAVEQSPLQAAGLFDEFLDADIECGPDLLPFKYEAGVTLDADARFEASWGPGQPTRIFTGFDVTATVQAVAKAVAAVNCTKEATVFEQRLTPVYFQLGAVPVVVVPRLRLDVSATAGFAGEVEANWTYTATLSTGLEYLDGTWTPSYETTDSSTFANHDLKALGEAKVSLGPAFSLDLYGVTGPYLSADLTFGAKVQTGEPRWEVGGELTVQIGAVLDVLFDEFKVDLLKVVLAKFVIARADAEEWSVEPPGQVLDIAARHVDDAGVYVVTRAPNAVIAYESDGQERWSVPLSDGVGSTFAVASTSDGLVVAYRSESGELSVVRFDDDGNEIWRRAEPGDGFHTVDVAVTSDDVVLVSARRYLDAVDPQDPTDARVIVRVFDAAGSAGALVEFDFYSENPGIAPGPDGSFYVRWEESSESSATEVVTHLERRTEGGAPLWAETFTSTGADIATYTQYLGLAADGGDVYLPMIDEITQSGSSRDFTTSVRRFDDSGNQVFFSRPVTNAPLYGLRLAIDSNGDVIEVRTDDGGQKVFRYSDSGNLETSSELALPVAPSLLDVEDGGSVYVAAYNYVARVALPVDS